MSIAANGGITRNTNRAACRYNGADYICYQDGIYIKVVKMVGGAVVQGPVTIHTYSYATTGRALEYADIHGTPSITVIPSGPYAGRVLVAVALHVTHLDVYRSNSPENISMFSMSRLEASASDGAGGATYPRLLALANGNIFCCYRYCVSATQHYQAFRVSTNGGASFGARTVLVQPKAGALNDVCYAAVEMKPGADEIHVPWTTSDYSRWYDQHHIYTTDGGSTWLDSSGNVVTLPATNASVPAFKTTAADRGNAWVYDVAFDHLGRPRLVGYDSDATTGRHYVWEWNGSAWTEHVLGETGSAATSYNAGFHPQTANIVIAPVAPAGVTSGLNADGQHVRLYRRTVSGWIDAGAITAPPGVTWDGFAQFVDHGDGTFVYSRFSAFNSNYTFAASLETGRVESDIGAVDFDLTLPSAVVVGAIDFDLTLPNALTSGAIDFDLELPGVAGGLTPPRYITAPVPATAEGVSDTAAIVGGDRWSATAEPFWP